MLNFGQQPNIRGEHRKTVRNESAKEFVEMMQGTFKLAKESLEHAAEDMKRFHDRKSRTSIEYQPGDLVLLEGTNIRSDRPSKKSDTKRYGPFKVVEKVGNAAYKLKLDPKWRGVHNVFNECLLHPYTKGAFPSQKTAPPPPPDIINGVEEQEIKEILASRERRNKIEYLVAWKGYPSEENEWITESNLANAPDSIRDFHRSHPTAPRPEKKLRLRYQANIPDAPCVCPICLDTPPTSISSSSLFVDPDFLEFRKQFQKYPESMFELVPSNADVTP